ncbi:hypothetical protein CPB85DRAFT_1567759 [Mucidula mucida]|nr:hypothetical protein CPB85DRAFT_1567759 [Mucidula mucida]
MPESSPSCSSSSSASSFPETQALRQALFDFSAPPLERKRSQRVPIPTSPLHFLDSHLPESLTLRHVKIHSSLHVEIFGCLDSFSEELDDLNPDKFAIHEFSAEGWPDSATALSVIHTRRGPIRFASTQITSSLVLHTSQPDLSYSLLRWVGARSELRHTLLDEAYASQDLALYVVKPDATDYVELNGKTRELLERIRKHTGQLISTMVFCTDALPVMEDMSRLDAMDRFPWRQDSLCPAASRSRSPPPDASAVPWLLPPPEARSFDIGTVERDGNGEAGYTPRCEDYVQKAWVHAVKTDTTVIVFDCGNFIRIGIRHRERQTLFLSNLIDIRTCKDPAYGGLWTSLQVAAALDALQRLPLLENVASSKRKATFDEPHRQIKRRKHDAATSRNQDSRSVNQTMSAYMAKFSALAVFFRFDLFDSPAPLLLVHPDAERKAHYGPSDYLKIIVYKRLGAGSVGDVYRAVIDGDTQPQDSKTKAKRSSLTKRKGKSKALDVPDLDDFLHRPFILKLALTGANARRLAHELQIYRHLEQAGVSGIPSLLGYRRGMDGDLRVLMLSDAGQPLGNRLDSERKVDLSPEARIELKSVLTSIHEAGVVHRDVRSWNIMEDEFGRDTAPSKSG